MLKFYPVIHNLKVLNAAYKQEFPMGKRTPHKELPSRVLGLLVRSERSSLTAGQFFLWNILKDG